MIVLLCLFFVLLSFIFRSSKIVAFLFFVFLWICFGWSGENADTEIYLYRYKYYKTISSTTEPLFTYLIDLGHKLNLDYDSFLILVSFLYLILLTVFVKKLQIRYVMLPFLFFLVYPFIMSVVIVRFTMAAGLIIYAFSFLLIPQKYGWLKYSLLVILATLIHSSSIFFLIFLLVNKISLKKTVFRSVIFLIFFLFASTLIKNVISADVLFLSDKIGAVNAEVENMEKTSFNYYFGTITRTVIAIVFFFYIYFRYYKTNKDLYAPRIQNIIDLSLKFNIIFFSSIGLYFISVDFSRLLFPILFLNYCVYALIIERSKFKIFIIILVLISCFLELYLLILRYDFMIKAVFDPFLNNNKLFES